MSKIIISDPAQTEIALKVASTSVAPFAAPLVHSSNFGLHAGVIWLMIGAYVYMLAMFWLMFGQHADSAFVVAISTGFLAIYAGLPIMMFRMGGVASDSARFSDFLHSKTDTNTGPLDGMAALTQVLTVPIALAIGATGFALILFIRG